MSSYSYQREQNARLRANSLFEQRWFTGKVKALLASLRGKSRLIPMFDYENADPTICEPGIRDIRVTQIVGTGAQQFFDCEFYPVYRRDKQRWVSVAVAMLVDSTSLPHIHVAQQGEKYYSLDGNHRVSVARAIGMLFLSAEVICYGDVEEES